MRTIHWVISASLTLALALIVSCSSSTPAAAPAEGQTLRDKAAAEATAIVQRAEATALVLQAHAKATALVQQASNPAATPIANAPTAAPPSSPTPIAATPGQAAMPTGAPTAEIAAPKEASASGVELLGVGFGADGQYINVQFKAPPKVAQQWRQGNVYVIEETKGVIYKDIPIMPILGPLLGRPQHEGQIGYVMLYNTSGGIRPGSVVTVVLGDFRQEHVTVKGPW